GEASAPTVAVRRPDTWRQGAERLIESKEYEKARRYVDVGKTAFPPSPDFDELLALIAVREFEEKLAGGDAFLVIREKALAAAQPGSAHGTSFYLDLAQAAAVPASEEIAIPGEPAGMSPALAKQWGSLRETAARWNEFVRESRECLRVARE